MHLFQHLNIQSVHRVLGPGPLRHHYDLVHHLGVQSVMFKMIPMLESNLAPVPLYLAIPVQEHNIPLIRLDIPLPRLVAPVSIPLCLSIPVQARNIPLTRLDIPLPRLVLAPVPLQVPLCDSLLILPVPLHLAIRIPVPLHLAIRIPVQARDIPLTHLDIPLHPPNIHLQAKVIAKIHPNTLQIPPDIHLQPRVTVQIPLILKICLLARLTVQFPRLTPLLPILIHLQAKLTVQVHPLTPRLCQNIRHLLFLTGQKVPIVQMLLKLNGNTLSGP